MNECWGEVGGSRKQPQAIMRDINQIKYQVYNSRREHSYSTAYPKRFNLAGNIENKVVEVVDSSDCDSRSSSLFTDQTTLPWEDPDFDQCKFFLFINKSIPKEPYLSILNWVEFKYFK